MIQDLTLARTIVFSEFKYKSHIVPSVVQYSCLTYTMHAVKNRSFSSLTVKFIY